MILRIWDEACKSRADERPMRQRQCCPFKSFPIRAFSSYTMQKRQREPHSTSYPIFFHIWRFSVEASRNFSKEVLGAIRLPPINTLSHQTLITCSLTLNWKPLLLIEVSNLALILDWVHAQVYWVDLFQSILRCFEGHWPDHKRIERDLGPNWDDLLIVWSLRFFFGWWKKRRGSTNAIQSLISRMTSSAAAHETFYFTTWCTEDGPRTLSRKSTCWSRASRRLKLY